MFASYSPLWDSIFTLVLVFFFPNRFLAFSLDYKRKHKHLFAFEKNFKINHLFSDNKPVWVEALAVVGWRSSTTDLHTSQSADVVTSLSPRCFSGLFLELAPAPHHNRSMASPRQTEQLSPKLRDVRMTSRPDDDVAQPRRVTWLSGQLVLGNFRATADRPSWRVTV